MISFLVLLNKQVDIKFRTPLIRTFCSSCLFDHDTGFCQTILFSRKQWAIWYQCNLPWRDNLYLHNKPCGKHLQILHKITLRYRPVTLAILLIKMAHVGTICCWFSVTNIFTGILYRICIYRPGLPLSMIFSRKMTICCWHAQHTENELLLHLPESGTFTKMCLGFSLAHNTLLYDPRPNFCDFSNHGLIYRVCCLQETEVSVRQQRAQTAEALHFKLLRSANWGASVRRGT